MDDYKELVRCLRGHSTKNGCAVNCICDDASKRGFGTCSEELTKLAADAIEELSRKIRELPRWIPFETRPMDAEEREYYSEHYSYELSDDEAVIYCCEMPDHDQEVLVCNKYGSVWMPLPEPPKEEKIS